MENIKDIIGRVKELRMHKIYIGEEASNGFFRAKAFSEAQDYGDILEALKNIAEDNKDVDLYKKQRAEHLLRHIIPEKEASLRVCDDSFRPVVEGELWTFKEARSILEGAGVSWMAFLFVVLSFRLVPSCIHRCRKDKRTAGGTSE